MPHLKIWKDPDYFIQAIEFYNIGKMSAPKKFKSALKW